MSFESELAAFAAKVQQRERDVFVGVAAAVKDSIVNGSAITGAPGQVVADEHGGELKGSWRIRFESPTVAIIDTKCQWAPQNEDGIARPGGGVYRQLSATGGRWSVAKTVLGFQQLVDAEVRKVNP